MNTSLWSVWISSRLRSSILQNKIADIGKIKTFEREVNLNADRKRFWLDNLTAINHETNDSVTISLNYFEIWGKYRLANSSHLTMITT